MEVLGIIPARGGSERLPRKNLYSLAGKPLISHTIEHSLQSHVVTRTVVSTEDDEIRQVSQDCGAEVVVRPENLSTETASSESALLHVVHHLTKSEGYEPDLIVFLQCTSPVRSIRDIDLAIQLLIESKADSLFSASLSKQLLWKSHGDSIEPLNYDFRNRRREQDMDPEWVENGSIYVFKPWVLLEQMNRLGGKIVVYPMDYWSSFQIDSLDDFEICDWILHRNFLDSRMALLPQRIEAVVFDFDGVFTNNQVIVSEDGKESVICHRGDGLGLGRLKASGVPILLLSTESNPVVAARCKKLGIECRQGLSNKGEMLKQFSSEKKIALETIVYLGNDLNDLECLAMVGCGMVVNDAHPSVRRKANLILHSSGGNGAVREACDLIVEKLGAKA
jgi:N-acylneuraminate cytidylyltransferase